MRKSLLFFLVSTIFFKTYAQVKVQVNMDVEHSVGGVSEFDREKFILLHADISDTEWDSDDQRKQFLEDWDVYLGRNNGSIVWEYNQTNEDPSKQGWPEIGHMISRGDKSINDYKSDLEAHKFEDRVSKMVIGGQPEAMFPHGQETNANGCCSNGVPWVYQNEEATAEFYANYLKNYFGNGGETGKNRPPYVEVLNEPFIKSNALGTSNEAISEFHNTVAKRIKEVNPEVKVGGYSAAHPAYEAAEFNHWKNNWKLFIDVAGENMDFYSFHLYDFRRFQDGEESQRKGSNMEAIMDMVEHYSVLAHGERKPWYITEYGYLLNERVFYNKQSDWYQVRTFNSMMMQMMERQDILIGAIPFMILKAEWGRVDGVPYGPRLLRQKKEVEGFEGNGNDWVYTDLVKFFQFWRDFDGNRVDSYSVDEDVLVDAYVNGNTAYVVINNLIEEKKEVDLEVLGIDQANVVSVNARHLYANESIESILEETDVTGVTKFEIGKEATLMLIYTLESDHNTSETSSESKYFADGYLKSISANGLIRLDIDGVQKSNFGEAVLRIGMGRDHGKSLKPSVMFNGTSIAVPENWKGDDQSNRDKFFGVLEIPVPYSLIDIDNEISITFSDDGGHVSSVTMQVFNFSKEIVRPVEEKTLGTDIEEDHLGQVTVFPNPASTFITVKGISAEPVSYSILSLTGARLQSGFITANDNQISLEGFRKGIYFLNTTKEGEKHTIKIVKK
ncbi:MAG: T9SS type A sorting domain-containing protein [Cyclobacteriaceae bacterium]